MRLRNLENPGQLWNRRPGLSSPSDQLLPLWLGEIHVPPGQRCRNPDGITPQLEAMPDGSAFLFRQATSYTGSVAIFQSSFKTCLPDCTGRADPFGKVEALLIRERSGEEKIRVLHCLSGYGTCRPLLPGLVSSDPGSRVSFAHH